MLATPVDVVCMRSFFHVNSLHRGPSPSDGDDLYRRRTIAVTWTASARPAPITQASLAARRGYVASYQPWTMLEGYCDGCRPATVALLGQRTSLLKQQMGPEKLAGLPDGPLKQRYYLEWHPATSTQGAQRAIRMAPRM